VAKGDYDGPMIDIEVGVPDLARHCSPFDGHEWECDPIDQEEVLEAAAEGVFETESWQSVNSRNRGRPFDDVGFHVGRLAYLFVHPDPTPVEIEIEGYVDRYGDYRRVRMHDGNHRLGAAMLREDEVIRAQVPECFLEDLREFLPSLKVVGTVDCSPGA